MYMSEEELLDAGIRVEGLVRGDGDGETEYIEDLEYDDDFIVSISRLSFADSPRH